MNTGSRDEQTMLNNIRRIAEALEKTERHLGRIANVLEDRAYGVTSGQTAAAAEQLRRDTVSP
jgi:hypothetical protein